MTPEQAEYQAWLATIKREEQDEQEESVILQEFNYA